MLSTFLLSLLWWPVCTVFVSDVTEERSDPHGAHLLLWVTLPVFDFWNILGSTLYSGSSDILWYLAQGLRHSMCPFFNTGNFIPRLFPHLWFLGSLSVASWGLAARPSVWICWASSLFSPICCVITFYYILWEVSSGSASGPCIEILKNNCSSDKGLDSGKDLTGWQAVLEEDFFFFLIFYWSELIYSISFRCKAQWFSYTCTYVHRGLSWRVMEAQKYHSTPGPKQPFFTAQDMLFKNFF